MIYKTRNNGFSLFMVMIIMLVIALLVMITAQSSNTETRMSANEADRKFAISLADTGLRQAENTIRSIVDKGKTVTFKDDCTDGLCAPQKVNELPENVNVNGLFKYDKDPDTIDSSGNVTKKGAMHSGLIDIPAWERCADDPKKRCDIGKTVIDKACETTKTCKYSSDDKRVHYIIEYLGDKKDKSRGSVSYHDYFRVTSRAYGNNKDTIVTLQSYLDLEKF